MKIILIRHAESEKNVSLLSCKGIKDAEVRLTKNGENQSKELLKLLQKFDFGIAQSVLISSNYIRSIQTAQFINNALNLEMIHDERIREIDYGCFNALTKEECFKLYPLWARNFQNTIDSRGFFYAKYPKGESPNEIYNGRIASFVRDVKKMDKKYDNIIIVGHGIVLKLLLMKIMNYDITWFEKEPSIKNCGIRIIDNAFRNPLDIGEWI